MSHKFLMQLCALFSLVPTFAVAQGNAEPEVRFNQHVIEATQSAAIDLNDRDMVLRHVLSAMPQTAIVYPSEGYYYFSFLNGGERVQGNLRFDVVTRNDGVVNFAYYKSHLLDKKSEFFWLLDQSDGVSLVKRAEFTYSLSFKDVSRTIVIYDASRELAAKPDLASNEEYVGPVFDESGVRFHLIFDHDAKEFLYWHNGSLGITETFRALDRDERVIIGNRTGYAYFNDVKRSRRILIGIKYANSAMNTYFDGPFDQLPDSFVDPLHIKGLIEKHDARAIGELGPFGWFLREPGTRYAIAPYLEYVDEDDLFKYLQCDMEGEAKVLSKCLTNEAQ